MATTPDTFPAAIVAAAEAIHHADSAEEHLGNKPPAVAAMLTKLAVDQAEAAAENVDALLCETSDIGAAAWAAVERARRAAATTTAT